MPTSSLSRLPPKEATILVSKHQSKRLVDVRAIAASVTSNPPSEDEVRKHASYRVPRAAPDGACSRPDDLEDEPFQVLDTYIELKEKRLVAGAKDAHQNGKQETGEEIKSREANRLVALGRVCQALQEATNSEWVGIYETLPADASQNLPKRLMKLAYRGAPSRAYFPLTPEFAANSNNSTVAMTKDTIIIQDVTALEGDTPYYQCDPTVLSETCAPILRDDGEGEAIGIIDVEAWKRDHFTEERVVEILSVCGQLGELDLLRG